MIDFLAELSWRGLVQDRSEGLEERLARGPIAAYVGFDASGPSLHVGHLVPLMALVHLQRHGGRPVAVVNRGHTRADGVAHVKLDGDAASTLDDVVRRLQ